MFRRTVPTRLRQATALAIALFVCALPATAGIRISSTQGLTMTGTDGIYFDNVAGLTMTGTDGLLTFGVNGIFLGATSDGLTMTGTDGLTMTGTDGLSALGIQSVHVDTSGQVVVTKTDGTVFYAPTNGLTVTGANALAATGAEGIVMNGVQNLLMTGWDGLASVESNPTVQQTGLESFDPELAVKLDRMTDDSNVNAVVVYHQTVTDSDIADLQTIGVRGGTRYRALPMVAVTATKCQIAKISRLANVRTVYGNRTLQWNDASHAQTGLTAEQQDSDLRNFNANGAPQGNGVTVALVDTG